MHKNRVIYLDYLRLIAMIAVVFIHTGVQKLFSVQVGIFDWHMFNLYTSGVRFAVPIFVMISGALMLNPQRNVTSKKLFSKILNLLVVLWIWSLFYAVFDPQEEGRIIEKLELMFLGHFHMWYLYMLVGLYLILPILRAFIENKKIVKYFLILSLIFSFILPDIIYICKQTQMSVLCIFADISQRILDDIDFTFAIGYVFYFVLGYYLSKVELNKKIRLLIYILGIVGFVATFLLTYFVSVSEGRTTDIFYSNFSVFVMLEAVAVFVFAKYELVKIKLNNTVSILIDKIVACSLGVYLVHMFVLDMLDKLFGLNVMSFNAVISVPLLSILVLLISLVIIAIMKIIPIIKKLV